MMNRENLDKLIANYIAKFEWINDETHREYYKWEAVKHFQDHWDIDAPNFASMFKEAVKATSNLINNGSVQPTNGIIKLAEHSELTEVIRQMFRDLLTDDYGDISKRQDKIDIFLDKADELLNRYYRGSWKYAQDMRTVIAYLSLIDPKHNYMYKSTQAKEFMYCIEYGNDFGSGKHFSLEKYYAMCDELVTVIKEKPELVELHQNRMTESMWADDDYHILAYDIIYSAVVYKLYNNITIVKPSNSKNKKHDPEKAKNEKRESLLAELTSVSDQLNDLLVERADYDDFSAKGLIVKHKSFGEGVVTAHNGHTLNIRFGEQEKPFQMPQGFSAGYLTTDSEEITELFNEMARIDDEITKAKSRKSTIQTQLSMLK